MSIGLRYSTWLCFTVVMAASLPALAARAQPSPADGSSVSEPALPLAAVPEPAMIPRLRALREHERAVLVQVHALDEQRRALSRKAGSPALLVVGQVAMIAGFATCGAVLGALAFTQGLPGLPHSTATPLSRSQVRAFTSAIGVSFAVGVTGTALFVYERNDPSRVSMRELRLEQRELKRELGLIRSEIESTWQMSPQLSWQTRQIGISLTHVF
jgi:hypothetical protein